MEKDLLRLYMEQEKESIERSRSAKNSLGVSNRELRADIGTLLEKQDKVLMSAVVRALAEVHGVKPEYRQQLRVRIVGLVKAKSSPFEYVKEDGRVWLRAKGATDTAGTAGTKGAKGTNGVNGAKKQGGDKQ